MQFPDEANFCPSCAQRLVPVEAPSQAAPSDDGGAFGGRFELGDRIGGNRTGEVFAATDKTNGAACVVKIVHPQVFPTPLLRQRSERELKQLERVQAPTVARVLAHGKRGDNLWVATERVGGQSLKAVVSQGVLSLDRAKTVLLKIGEALAEAAKVGVIHRDVSPKNVLVDGDAVKVINFGIPTPLSDTVQGEPEFLSPEQVEGKPVDQRSNIYSLGAMLYYMLCGQPPFVGDAQTVMQSHLQGNPPPPSQRGTVPPKVEAIILKALDRVSSKRFMTLRQLLTEVERADGTGAADSASQTSPFAAIGKGKHGAAARTMMGMFAPPTGPDGKPTDVVPVGPGAQEPPGAPSAAVASFAQSGAATAQSPPEPQPVDQAREAQATTQPEPAPVTRPEPAQAPQPQPAPQPAAQEPAPAAEPPAPSVPQPSAPSVPPDSSVGGAGGKRGKPRAESSSKKGQFRETLWFKKGELDAVAAEAAAAAAAQGKDDMASDKADSLPMEDRYADDGSVSVSDQQAYSLRTGHTQMMRAVDGRQGGASGMRDDDLIDEMKSGRMKVILLIAVAIALAVGVALFFILR